MTQSPIKSLDRHIEVTANICGGKPRIAGHRITVAQIAIWHERMGRSVDEIATEYDLDLADVHAALAYYFDHREQIDESMAQSQSWVADMKSKSTSLAQQKLEQDASHGGAN